MSKIEESVEVNCPSFYVMRHAERFFTVHRRGVTPGTIMLHINPAVLKLPGNTEIRHEVRAKQELVGEPGQGQRLRLSRSADDPMVPDFDGTLEATALDGRSILRLSGDYRPPFGPAGAAFDAIAGRRIASATMTGLLQDLKAFVESDFATARSTELGASPKE